MALILLVEDQAQVLTLAESFLRQHGHDTVSASTAEEALAVLQVTTGVDLLFTDIGLRDNLQAGLELAKQVREQHPKINVLYATGQQITDGMKALMVDGAALLEKPYSVDQLEAALVVHFGIKPSAPKSS